MNISEINRLANENNKSVNHANIIRKSSKDNDLQVKIEESIKNLKEITAEFLLLSDKNKNEISVKEKNLKYCMLIEGVSSDTIELIINRLKVMSNE